MSALGSALRNIATESSLAFLLKVIAVPLALLANLVMARLYGAEAMGTYFIAFNLVSTIGIVCTFGLNTGLLRFIAVLKEEGREREFRRLFWLALTVVSLLCILAAIVLFGLRNWLVGFFKAPQLPSVLPFMALALPVAVVITLCNETLRALDGVRWVVFQEQLLKPISFVSLIIILASIGPLAGGKPAALGISYLTAALLGLGFLACSPVAKTLFRPHRGTGIESSPFKELLRYSWPIFLVSVFGLSSQGLDSLVLGYFTSPKDVAYYGVATRIMPMVLFPLFAINAVVPPLFVKFFQQRDMEGLETVARTTARWMYYLSLPLALLLILLAPEVLAIFGPNFVKARLALSALAVSQLINVASGSVGFLLIMTGNQWTYSLIQISAGAILVPLMVLGGATLGLNGVAFANAIGVALTNVAMVWAVWRRLRIKAFAQKVQRANLGGLAGIALFLGARLFLGAIGGAIAFILGYILWIEKPLRQEISQVFAVSK
jgi:O-antigen/teichoic acid export membrane protein